VNTLTNAQEVYVQFLEQIKDAEELAQLEIDAKKKAVEQEIQTLQSELKQEISEAKQAGERLVEQSVAQASKTATAEADKIINAAKNKAKSISVEVNDKVMKPVFEILIKGIE